MDIEMRTKEQKSKLVIWLSGKRLSYIMSFPFRSIGKRAMFPFTFLIRRKWLPTERGEHRRPISSVVRSPPHGSGAPVRLPERG